MRELFSFCAHKKRKMGIYFDPSTHAINMSKYFLRSLNYINYSIPFHVLSPSPSLPALPCVDVVRVALDIVVHSHTKKTK